jgi:hypothetical protein
MFNSHLYKSYKESSHNELLNIKNDLDKIYNYRIYSDDFLYYKYGIDKFIYIKLHKDSNEIECYYNSNLYYKYFLVKKGIYYQISYDPKIITKIINNKTIYLIIKKFQYINYSLYHDKYFLSKEVNYEDNYNIKKIRYYKQTFNFNYIQDNILIIKNEIKDDELNIYMRNFKIIVLSISCLL